MYSLLLLIPNQINQEKFDRGWPSFLHQAEKMPGMLKETATLIDQKLTGVQSYSRLYTFHFSDKDSLHRALSSPPGQKAGELIHTISEGKALIFTGDFREDQLANLHPSPSQDSNHAQH